MSIRITLFADMYIIHATEENKKENVMKGVRPCPYCGGEVEVVRLKDLKGERTYRIQCYRCRKVVGRGLGFPNEKKEEALERIQQYEEYMDKMMNYERNLIIKQSEEAKSRDEAAKYSSRIDPENEFED